jgi:biopolymer transport protein ExbD
MVANHNIDVLPLAAIGLILVILMVIMAPMVTTHANTPVEVPAAHTQERDVEEDIAVTLTNQDHGLYLNDVLLGHLGQDTVANRLVAEKLSDGLKAELAKDPYKLTIVRGDKDIMYVDVLEILAACRRAGALRMACATRQDTSHVY